MIPCPSCGVRNRRGSKYCYRCGQRLDVNLNTGCPACDRLNPADSAFCAFCGAAMAKVPSADGPAVAEEPVVGGSPVETPQPPLESEPPGAEPVSGPKPELPPWLYEQAAASPVEKVSTPDGASASMASASSAQSKYLSDIPGALPKTEGWLSSAAKPEKPAEPQAPPSKPKGQAGCLTLAMAAVAIAGLVLAAAL